MLFDFAALAPGQAYKLLTSTVVPRPIAWVVTQDRQGRLNAAPFSFFNVFSGEPPIVCLGIGNREDGTPKDSAAAIMESGDFVINLVSEEVAKAMNITAAAYPPGTNELVEAGLETLPSTRVRPPRIGASPVALECEKVQVIHLEQGNHLVIGRVLAMHVKDEAVLDRARCHIDTPALHLIGRLHGGGVYVRLTDTFNMPRPVLPK